MSEYTTAGGEVLVQDTMSPAEISEIEELYKQQGILDSAKENAKDHTGAYEAILKATKGSFKAKMMAAMLIPRYVHIFPDHFEQALNAQLDLCEEEDLRIHAIKGLPQLSVRDYTNVANVLVQLLYAAGATHPSPAQPHSTYTTPMQQTTVLRWMPPASLC